MRLARGFLAGGAAALLALSASLPASANAVYTYWSLWLLEGGQWTYAQEGAGTTPALDGGVVCWSFTRSDAADATPALSPDFNRVCGEVLAEAGQARVALVIDFGDAADYSGEESVPAPLEECVVVEEGSTMATVLLSTHTVRDEGGFVCAIDDLPAAGCAEEVADAGSETTAATTVAGTPATEPDSGLGVAMPWVAALALAAAAAVAVARRRRGGGGE